MVEQLTLQTLLLFIQAIGILVGVTYHIMTLSNTRKNQHKIVESEEVMIQLLSKGWTLVQQLNGDNYS